MEVVTAKASTLASTVEMGVTMAAFVGQQAHVPISGSGTFFFTFVLTEQCPLFLLQPSLLAQALCQKSLGRIVPERFHELRAFLFVTAIRPHAQTSRPSRCCKRDRTIASCANEILRELTEHQTPALISRHKEHTESRYRTGSSLRAD